ncbi:putative cytokinin dehydrogenase [Rosa chinensis]|uniref:cytokinin dehydrogenase n=1 Tax=Rosa chinensis TaxID=74649 RepID=A0A2P6RKA4_ROSCH|nr:putative cytokinin dehydrogenase [Rosa chinensis]
MADFFTLLMAPLLLGFFMISAVITGQLGLPDDIASKLQNDSRSINSTSTDYGHIVQQFAAAVLYPNSTNDIATLLQFANNGSTPFGIAARGQGHSVRGQALTQGGIVINMTTLNNMGSRIVVSENTSLGSYADVGGEQLWIDVLRATLDRGLSPVSWTDYLYLSVGGTLSNAGISGQTFRFGPQITNVYELDVVTGKGDLITCSSNQTSELFYSALGGLGQVGIITRARIALRSAPKRAKWIRLFYNDFSAFSKDQEHLISTNGIKGNNGFDYVEGFVLMRQGPVDFSFYPVSDQPRITSLLNKYGILYTIELAKYYDDTAQNTIEKVIVMIYHVCGLCFPLSSPIFIFFFILSGQLYFWSLYFALIIILLVIMVGLLLNGLSYVPGFIYQQDVSYIDFLNRVHTEEEMLRQLGLWDIAHPWLNLFVPKSRIADFDSGVFKSILLKEKVPAGLVIIYPMNRNKWDDKMSAVIPEENVFYVVALLHSSGLTEWQRFDEVNAEILQFCNDAGIMIKQYLPHYEIQQDWIDHFGSKLQSFQKMKVKYDPNKILAPGQRVFNG